MLTAACMKNTYYMCILSISTVLISDVHNKEIFHCPHQCENGPIWSYVLDS